jgi:hypothetical protein
MTSPTCCNRAYLATGNYKSCTCCKAASAKFVQSPAGFAALVFVVSVWAGIVGWWFA